MGEIQSLGTEGGWLVQQGVMVAGGGGRQKAINEKWLKTKSNASCGRECGSVPGRGISPAIPLASLSGEIGASPVKVHVVVRAGGAGGAYPQSRASSGL